MSSAVLDGSALLVLLGREAGADQVGEAVLQGAAISAVNLAEVVAKLVEHGLGADELRDVLLPLALEVVPFDADAAFRAGLMRSPKKPGLSLGDRACLALAAERSLPVVTADKGWGKLQLPVQVRVVR